MKGLQQKKVLITGGAKGIGRACVSRFLEEGSRLAVMDIDAEGVKALEEEIPELELSIIGDVSCREDIQEVFGRIDEKWDGLDVVINNAGISIRNSFNDIRPQDWRRVIDVNLTGIFYVAQAAAQRMPTTKGGGVILNMGSTNALTGYPFYAGYNASKAGVVELTRSMALELAPSIRVNAICPGYIMTPMQESEYTPEMLKECADKIPLKRLGKPEEVAALFAFLASDEARFITGQCYIIDGGETSGGLASR